MTRSVWRTERCGCVVRMMMWQARRDFVACTSSRDRSHSFFAVVRCDTPTHPPPPERTPSHPVRGLTPTQVG